MQGQLQALTEQCENLTHEDNILEAIDKKLSDTNDQVLAALSGTGIDFTKIAMVMEEIEVLDTERLGLNKGDASLQTLEIQPVSETFKSLTDISEVDDSVSEQLLTVCEQILSIRQAINAQREVIAETKAKSQAQITLLGQFEAEVEAKTEVAPGEEVDESGAVTGTPEITPTDLVPPPADPGLIRRCLQSASNALTFGRTITSCTVKGGLYGLAAGTTYGVYQFGRNMLYNGLDVASGMEQIKNDALTGLYTGASTGMVYGYYRHKQASKQPEEPAIIQSDRAEKVKFKLP